MKRNLSFVAISSLLILVTIVGCKKEDSSSTASSSNNSNSSDVASQSQKASDDSEVEGNSNTAFDDANKAIDGFSQMSGKKEGFDTEVCGASFDTSQISSKIIFITYDGTTLCGNGLYKRSGQIKLQLPIDSKWKDVGAVLTVTFTNYKVTRVSDNKSITFNGVSTIKNTSGGTILNILTGGSLVHQVRLNEMQIIFDDGTVRNWSGAWRRTLSGMLVDGNPIITIAVAGDTTLNETEYVESWGTTREGDPFITTLNPPVVFNTICFEKAISGVKTITVTNATIGTFVLTITVGVEADGSVTTTGCPYGYKLNWNDLQGKPQEVVLQYK